MSKGFRVTVEDLDTGERQAMVIAPGDMVLIPFAPCYKAGSQHYPKSGTTVITVKDHRPQFPARAVLPPDDVAHIRDLTGVDLDEAGDPS